MPPPSPDQIRFNSTYGFHYFVGAAGFCGGCAVRLSRSDFVEMAKEHGHDAVQRARQAAATAYADHVAEYGGSDSE